jgi:DNA-directed RNA polymerase alpha subunit
VISRIPKRKKPGPPATGKGTPILVRLQPDLLKALDSWATLNTISRPEAIRRLVELGLLGPKVMIKPSPDLPDETLLQDLNLPTRIQNALVAGGLRTVGEVRKTSSSDLLTFQGVGKNSITVIRELLGQHSA